MLPLNPIRTEILNDSAADTNEYEDMATSPLYMAFSSKLKTSALSKQEKCSNYSYSIRQNNSIKQMREFNARKIE